MPDEFHFKYAQVALSAGLLEAAIDSVSKYLVVAGRAGKFYREALELLDQAEKKRAELLEEEVEKKSERKKAQAQADEHLTEALRLIAEKKDKDTVTW